MAELQAHEFANLFPAMPDFDFQELTADIKQYGLFESITTFEGKILDGRHRQKACLKAKVKPNYWKFDGTREEALAYVVSKNRHRRNLTVEQRAFAGVEAAKLFAVEAAKRQKSFTPKTGCEPSSSTDDNGRSVEKAAEAVGVSPKSIERAAKIEEHADPKIVEAAKAGEVSLSDAAKVAELPKAEQREALKAVESGEAKTLAAAVAAAPKKTTKLKKNGAPIYDDKIIEKAIGSLVRALDARNEAYGGKTQGFKNCHSSLNEFLADWKAWKKAGSQS